ncbi:ABC transporter permease [Solirubrum puertoriconensis]|uniref:Peptidase M1 membrane alanine aminopeptidase domain-containing protein n=1 Tax=Solirubrum puertoriconensis TaxID=1751427 RepID=A0A9X0HM82_SOLP1|nr:ABC transporter permease [Solirubrum puertoriconensis]KUG08513.1 hypothetical protein ASU33_10145 [Solirubrum puertoriconensis]
MKFWAIYRFELAYQLRRPWPWLFVVVLLALNFLMTRDGSVAEVLYSEFYLNSPFAVAKTTVFGSLVWLVMAAAIAGDAAARDVQTRMHPLLYTTPISKAQYLGGKFLAALVLNALVLLAVQAGIVLGAYLPGVDAELIGPFRPAAFLGAYGIIALPNALVATAIQFGLAARSGRAMASYFGSFLIVFMGFFVASMLLFKRSLGTLLDPIGIRFVVEDMAHLWTPAEKNGRLLALEGTLLTNRLLWLGLAVVVGMVTYLSFRFAHRAESSWLSRFRKRHKSVNSTKLARLGIAASTPVVVPPVRQQFGLATHVRQLLAVASDSFRMIVTSWAGLAMLVALPLLTVPVVLDQMSSNGVPLVPTTALVVKQLTASLADELSRWVVVPFLIVFFAGELMWRERDARVNEITDAMPSSELTSFLGKYLGLGGVLLVFMALLAAAGMLAQATQGYQNFEVALYLKTMLGLQLPEYLLFAMLALVVHVVVDQKYVGHLVAILVFVFITLASLFGIEHNLLIYGAGPGWSYSEMIGFGNSLGPWVWFKLYWAAWALLLLVAARLLWARGKENNLGQRLQVARRRFTRGTAVTAGIAAVLVLALGGFIFYNTNVLNVYSTAAEGKARSAEYERRFARYANRPQPQRSAANLRVEIYPERQAADIRGSYRLVNRSAVAIDSVHVATAPGVETDAITFDRPATRVLADKKLHQQIYALQKPLQPGDSLQLNFRVQVAPRGFRENGVDGSVVTNGTYFSNSWLPTIGYQASRELTNAGERRAHGLAPRPVIASLYNTAARGTHGVGTAFEAVVGTAADQIAVAPGALRHTWAEGGRRYFRYATDAPISGEWGFFSAKYALHQEQWQNPDKPGQVVTIQLYHHPKHTAHLGRVLASAKASLDYYTKQFGPYRYKHLSIVERPGLGTGMHADASMISHGEGFTFWNPENTPGSHDHPYAIVAHEMAHQWTVPYAAVEGAPVMSESLAWYYGLKLVEHAKGPEHLQHLLDYMRQPYPYPVIRRGEPLLRGLDPYMSYRKGPFVLYALSEYLGEEPVNAALRRLLEKHRQADAPLATTLDLYRELRAVTPDSLRPLLHDLFEVNTFWELRAERATARQTLAGTWQVALEVRARKVVVDSAGTETEVPLNDVVEVGASAAGNKPLYRDKHRLRTGRQTITFTVPRQPLRAGIDPNHLLPDLKPEDNTADIKP